MIEKNPSENALFLDESYYIRHPETGLQIGNFAIEEITEEMREEKQIEPDFQFIIKVSIPGITVPDRFFKTRSRREVLEYIETITKYL